jgi:PEGA domain
MALIDGEETPRPGRSWSILVLAAGLAAAIGAWVLWAPREEPADVPSVARSAPAAAEPSTAPGAAETPAPRPETRRADPAPRPERPSPAEPAPPAAVTGVLRVRSDVPGASVFLDRKYLGTTPLEVDGLDPGTHRLNVSIEGYDGHAQAIEIGDAPAEVEVKFREVTIDAAIPVIHKHAMGSCSGRLVASVQGLRYESANRGDAFTLRYADLETFAIDYLKKNLRVKQRGGKTWNFDDPDGNADALFVFHRDVEAARKKLAGRS